MTGPNEPPPAATDDSALDDPRLIQAVREYQEALEAGRPIDRTELLARHPDLAADLADCLDGLEMLHAVPGDPTSSFGRRPRLATAHETADLSAPLGDYRIIREIGRGGMGVVYEAEQLSLGRRIALKVLPFALTLDSRQLQRFKNEARAAAHLHHSHIVPVYSVGCERGVHFYAMQLIEGQTLADVIAGLRRQQGLSSSGAGPGVPPANQPTSDYPPQVSPTRQRGKQEPSLARRANAPPPAGSPSTVVNARASRTTMVDGSGTAFFRKVAELGVQAAEALEHAHQVGVLHRDIKPGNLLLDVNGHLWVTDFGLALLQNDAALTIAGELVGTLRYMSPEQSRARRGLVDHRTDIYALGATLYEMLTLRPIFDGKDREELLRQIAFEEPVPPHRLRKSLPADLETIVLKAVAKQPEDRYASAQEMADDLRRFLDQKPIRARRPSLRERALKWSMRHKATVTVSLLLLLLAAVGFAVSTLLIAAENIRAEDAIKDQKHALKAKEDALRSEQYQRAKADRNYREARNMLTRFTQVSMEEQPQAVRRKLLELSLEYYAGFIDRHENDPLVRLELVESSVRVAELLDKMGQTAAAVDFLERARAGQEAWLRQNPQAPEEKEKLERIKYTLTLVRAHDAYWLLRHPPIQKELKLTPSQIQMVARISEKKDRERNHAFHGCHGNQQPDQKDQERQELAVHEKALIDSLSPEQSRRLKELIRQHRGIAAFETPEVVRELGLQDEQKKEIRSLRDSVWRSAFNAGRGYGSLALGGGKKEMQRRGGWSQGEHGKEGERAGRRPWSEEHERVKNGERPQQGWWAGNAMERFRDVEPVLKLLTPEQRQRWEKLVGKPFRGLPPAFPFFGGGHGQRPQKSPST